MDSRDGVEQPLVRFDDDTAAALVAAASDITLMVTQDGVIVNASGDSRIWESVPFRSWIGRRWIDTVSSESRVKVEEMLRDVRSGEQVTRWRHINQRGHEGQDIPVLFSLVKTGRPNQFVAIGRDLRSVAELQARLLEAQQFMERDYLRLRRLENQYRLLFDLVNEPVIVLRLDRLQVIECNRAAGRFFGAEPEQLTGRSIDSLLDSHSIDSLRLALRQVDSSGRSSETTLRFAGKDAVHTVSVFHLKRDDGSACLIRIDDRVDPEQIGTAALLQCVAHSMSDGIVVCDSRGSIQFSNQAFVEMVQAGHHGQLIGENLSRWLGRANTDLQVMLNSLAQGGQVRLFATQLLSEGKMGLPVEISGVAIEQSATRLFAFTVREVGRRLGRESKAGPVGRSGEDLAALVGRMPLREIVGETVDLIERLCIESALTMTKNNRASAADMLGLSRQSLYVKLRRFGIDGGQEDESA